MIVWVEIGSSYREPRATVITVPTSRCSCWGC